MVVTGTWTIAWLSLVNNRMPKKVAIIMQMPTTSPTQEINSVKSESRNFVQRLKSVSSLASAPNTIDTIPAVFKKVRWFVLKI